MGLLLVLGLALLIIALEVPEMLKKKMWKELTVFSVLLFLGVFIGGAVALGIKLPNPVKAMEIIFKPLSKLMF